MDNNLANEALDLARHLARKRSIDLPDARRLATISQELQRQDKSIWAIAKDSQAAASYFECYQPDPSSSEFANIKRLFGVIADELQSKLSEHAE